MLAVFTLPLLFVALAVGIGVCLWLYGVLVDKEWGIRHILIRSVAGGIAGMALLWTAVWSLQKVTLSAQDIYGTYRVDREIFPGRQADWQHDRYELTIAEAGTILLTEHYGGGSHPIPRALGFLLRISLSAIREYVLPKAGLVAMNETYTCH